MKFRGPLVILTILTLGAGHAPNAQAKKGDKARTSEAPPPHLASSTFEGLEWRGIGPALMAGRIADIAVHPDDQSTWYVGVGSGGVWKTTNAGTTWEPIFDGEGSYSIGVVAIDPNNPQVIWVGTGENVGGRHVGYGDGVYRSLDGGASWENMGLGKSEHIGKILIDPRDSDVVHVAAQGPLWSPGGERGVYTTRDGGQTWEKVLGGGEYTGANELAMDPRDPNILFAAMHQRFRNVAALIDGGPETAIHKSTDGGRTWRKLENGLPEEEMGRTGLAISPQNPDVVYAAIELAHRKGGFYRSADGGESWTKMSDQISGGTGPHYYQEIYASPHKFDRVYFMDVRMSVTEDGGKTFTQVPTENKHVDNHALVFDPTDPNYLLSGNDGGLYESWDLGENWKFIANLPITQFYKVAIDYDEPFYNVVGGTQDNNSQHGPSRTDNTHGIRNSDWMITLFGDGHQSAVDPTNPDIIYSEWQQGNLVRHDRKTGEIVYIQPQPEADEEWDRYNWDAPILISAHDPKRLYYASQRVWRSDDRGDRWTAISEDLSRGLDRFHQPMMGRVQSYDAVWDLYAMSKYGTVTSLAESPLDEDLLYAGTDDGLIQVSENGGADWRRIDRLPGVPEFFFVNDLKADLHDPNTVYAAVDNHKAGDFSPYLVKSTDRGRTWSSIAGDLPDRHIVWRLVQDHVDPDLFFAGTEFGVFFTIDGGAKWIQLEGGAPTIPFRDLAIQKRENDLVGATFGRSFWILDDYTPLRGLSKETLEQEAELFPVRKARWYIPRRTLGREGKASQGAAFFVAPNPPFGAVFTYYLKDELQTRKKARQEAEKKAADEGSGTPSPGWEALRAEELEEDPATLLTVRDSDGRIVRQLEGPVESGFHRVSWDLRFPSPDAWEEEPEEDFFTAGGILAPPGTYSVGLAKRVDGQVTDLGKSQSFEVVPLRTNSLSETPPAEVAAFLQRYDALKKKVEAAAASIAEVQEGLVAVRETLVRSTAGSELGDETRRIGKALADLDLRLNGSEARRIANDPGPVSIQRRLQVVFFGTNWSTYGPTPTHRRSLEIAAEDFAQLDEELRQIRDVEIPALREELDAAGVPWTPGRGGSQ